MYHHRYLRNLAKLVDAYHIFASNYITAEEFERGKLLLREFVFEFEQLYGQHNMVFNVHLLGHIATCVQKTGPLCMYSAYSMEDNIGHLVSMVHGTTDVLKQCSQRYLLEQNLKRKIKCSDKAMEYYEKIQNHVRPNKELKCTLLSEEEETFIHLQLGSMNFAEFEDICFNGDFYRTQQCEQKYGGRKTNDSFLVTNDGRFGSIRSIFVDPDDIYYLLIRVEHCLKINTLIKSIHYLKTKQRSTLELVRVENIGKKAIFVQYSNFLAFSTCPNRYEKN